MPSAKSLLLLVFALIAIGLSLLAWKQHQELIQLRAAALTSGERADWQKRVWAAQKRLQNLTDQLSAARSGSNPATATSARGPAGGPPFGSMIANFASAMDRPEAARLMAMRQKSQIDARYGALFRKLGLAADKLAQFKSLLADKMSAPMDVLASAGKQGVDPMQNPQQFGQLLQNAQAEAEDKIKALLDPSAYSQYQNYVQTEPQRTVVNQLQQALSYTDTPLIATQSDQLVKILAETSPARGNATAVGVTVETAGRPGSSGNVVVAMGGPLPEMMGGMFGSTVTDEAVTRAQSVLSAPQVQALQEIQQQQQAAAQLRQQMFQGAGASGLPPPMPLPPPPGG
jgi:hypothetical protein